MTVKPVVVAEGGGHIVKFACVCGEEFGASYGGEWAPSIERPEAEQQARDELYRHIAETGCVADVAPPEPVEPKEPVLPALATWSCKIGEVPRELLGDGADAPLRQAVEAAYLELTGVDAAFCFSGWAGELDDAERAAVTP